jgi:hypothetical protein
VKVRIYLFNGALFLLAATGGTGACTSRVDEPPAIGNCVPIGEASCIQPGNGSGAVPLVDASMSEVDAGVEIGEAGSCGVDILPTPANSLCLPCISTAVPSGSGCCGAMAACAIDPNCFGRVQCAAAGPAALATCGSPEDETTLDLIACLETVCSPMCSDLVLDLTSEQ